MKMKMKKGVFYTGFCFINLYNLPSFFFSWLYLYFEKTKKFLNHFFLVSIDRVFCILISIYRCLSPSSFRDFERPTAVFVEFLCVFL